jgi:nitrogen-specific signal transduction histidine kinase/BarA-like signal transduction histidine kinase
LSVFGAQAALAIENARLYREMKIKMDQELEIQQKMAEAEKLRALGLMASGIYHNFNNLLTVILGNAELIEATGASDNILKKVSTIKRAALDGASVVNRVLSFTRSQDGQDQHQFVSLNLLINEAVRMTEPVWKGQAQSRGIDIQVSTSLSEERLTTPGNESALKEVLVNLIFNAVDAMPEGGGIELSSFRRGDEVCISVEDTGVGMSPEISKRIFDPFFSTKGVGHSGLGMSSAYGIIKHHQGLLEVESTQGQGTKFIPGPCRANWSHPTEEAKKPVSAELMGLNILLVDDEEKVGAYVSEALTRKGHQVTYVSDALGGLSELENNPYDLMITDLVMPQMSGWEMIERAKFLRPEIYIGLMTGWEVSDSEMEDRGIEFIIRKPFKISELMHVITQAMA